MKLYLAPLEGITTYIYRNAFHRLFGSSVDKYFAPFLMPHIKRDMNFKEKKDLIPENNTGIPLIPQLLTDQAEDFLRYEKILQDMGYDEININFGCPSGTVASKGRGAGFLARKEELDVFLEKVYTDKTGRVSVKTRLGIEDPEEFYEILEIYNKYPMEELIIHPRVQKEQYKGLPHRDIFLYALKNSRNPLVYNGDIRNEKDLYLLQSQAKTYTPDMNFDLMIGRGAIADPSIFRRIRSFLNGQKSDRITESELTDLLLEVEMAYTAVLSGDTQVLFRLKELWTWLIGLFPENEKVLKKLLKCKNLQEFHVLQKSLIETLPK